MGPYQKAKYLFNQRSGNWRQRDAFTISYLLRYTHIHTHTHLPGKTGTMCGASIQFGQKILRLSNTRPLDISS
jgi:hypothetical protein